MKKLMAISVLTVVVIAVIAAYVGSAFGAAPAVACKQAKALDGSPADAVYGALCR